MLLLFIFLLLLVFCCDNLGNWAVLTIDIKIDDNILFLLCLSICAVRRQVKVVHVAMFEDKATQRLTIKLQVNE